jgi:hypothetical protein
MTLELQIEKTNIPKNLIITEENINTNTKYNFTRYTFSEPIVLPYDKRLNTKVARGAKISRNYFTNMLISFLEDTLPEVFPEEFYPNAELEGPFITHFDNIYINPTKADAHFQYSVNLELNKEVKSKNSLTNIELFNVAKILTYVTLNTIPLPFSEENDIVTNGYFPRIQNGKIEPVSGVTVTTGYTIMSLPEIIYNDFCKNTFIGEISAPIMQTLLHRSPLFFPEAHPISKSFYHMPTSVICLKDSKVETIQKALEFRELLCEFMIANRKELMNIAEDFGIAKTATNIPLDKDLQDYDPKNLYIRFNSVNRRIEDMRPKLSLELLRTFSDIY